MKKHQDAFEAEMELYKLMKMAMYETGLGEKEDDYTKTISLDIGGGTLSYDPYYQDITYNDEEIEGLEALNSLIKEITKRLALFEKKTKEIRDKAAQEVFGKELKCVGTKA